MLGRWRIRWRAVRGLVAALVVGLFIGIHAGFSISAQEVERLLLQQGRLIQELGLYRSRLEQLQREGEEAPKQAWQIENVDLQLLWPDEADRLDLSEYLQPLTQELIGRRLDNLDPYLVYAIFEGRRIDLEHRAFLLTPRVILLGRETRIILDVHEASPPDP